MKLKTIVLCYKHLFFSAPVFIFQWQFDEAQMTADNVAAPVTQAQWNFIHHQGRNIRKTLESVSAVFAPSCISHTVITKSDWVKVTVNGVTLPDALQCWVSQTQPGEADLDNGYEGVTRSQVQSDSPVDPRRINANMLKALNHYHLSRGSQHKLRHKDGVVVDNRTNKRVRKRGKRNKRKCKYGETLENRIKCAQEENKLQHQYQNDQRVQSQGDGFRRNRDLIKSLDKRHGQDGSKRRKRRHRRRGMRSDVQGRKLTREEKKKIRREERRRLKAAIKARKEREKLLRQQKRQDRSLKLRHKKFSHGSDYSTSAGLETRKQKSLTVRSIQMRHPAMSHCPQKHVDTCSWPQCNRSCPKLHNPLTGKNFFK